MKRKKILAILLCFVLLAALFGCHKTNPSETDAVGNGGTTNPKPKETTTVSETTAVNLEGYVFRLGGSHLEKFTPVAGSSALHDQWNEELRQMQEAHGFRLEMLSIDNTLETVTAHIMAGEDIADFFLQRHSDFFLHSISGRVKPLDGEELQAAGFNVWDAEKWDPVYTEISRFNDHIWAVMTNGDYYLACFGDLLCFNPELTDDVGYDAAAIYDLVRNKEWTWSKYLDIARQVARDTDGDGLNDLWGTGAGVFQFGEMLVTNDFSPIYRGENGKWTADFTNPRYLNALNFISEATSPVIRDASLGNSGGPFKQAFAEGKIAFNQFYGWNFWEEPLTTAAFQFGVIPTPLGQDAENYVSVLPEIDSWTMLSTAKNVEKSVACMNLWGDIMTNDRWKERTKNECFRDEASWEMFETYIYPNTRLNWQQATEETWEYIRENIIKGVLQDRNSAAAAAEGHNPVIQAMLDAAFNK